MKHRTAHYALGLTLLALLLLPLSGKLGEASSHREAPLMMLDPTADLTDVYAFVSPEDASTVTLMLNAIPFQDPNGGPNFYRFDDNVLYAIRVDNDGDAVEDVVFEFRTQTDIQNGETFLYNTGPIGSLNDPAYNYRQTYTVERVDVDAGMRTVLGSDLPIPPENIGPASVPSYESLALMGVQDLGGGVKVFAGQRDDPFFVDLGAIFDLLTIRPGPPGNLGGGIDGVGGFNVHSFAIQVPIEMLTADGEGITGPFDADAVIGTWATTSRPTIRVLNTDGTQTTSGPLVQVSRLGLPLINEVIIPLNDKDRFNASQPANDVSQFGDEVLDPEPARLLNLLYGIDVPDAPRNDLLFLLTGFDGFNKPMNATGEVVPSDMIRLNMGIPPSTPDDPGFSSLGALGGDPAGFPNGRRLFDDVVDIELRVLAGVLVPGFNGPPNALLGDGVAGNDRPFMDAFPYLATPHQGFLHDHHPVSDAPPVPECPAGISISGFDADQPGDPDTGEFIEISGPAGAPLDGCYLALFDGATDRSYFSMQLTGRIDAGGFYLIANPGVPGAAQAIPNNTLQNGPDAIAILRIPAPPNTRVIEVTGDVIAAVVYVNDDTIIGRVPAAGKAEAESLGDLMGAMAASTDASSVPDEFALADNYPNPFNPTTTIPFQLASTSRVTLEVYDMTGRLVRTLINEERPPAAYQVTWDGRDQGGRKVASGTYIYRLRTDDYVKARKMTLLK